MSEITDFSRMRVLVAMAGNNGVDRPDLMPREVRPAATDLLEQGFVQGFQHEGKRWIRLTEAGRRAVVAAMKGLQQTFPDHCAVIDRGGDTWVRVDGLSDGGPWWPLTDGPGWEPRARNGVGTPRGWAGFLEYGPFVSTGAMRGARALARVRQAAAL
jgi:hypothetical protein